MWLEYIKFLEGLEEVYQSIQSAQNPELENQRKQKLKQVFERALECVGFLHIGSA